MNRCGFKNACHWLAGVFVIGFLMCPVMSEYLKGSNKKSAVSINSQYLNVLKWRSIGPHRGGRVVAVAGHPSKRNVFYFGGTGSGVWKSVDGGKNWRNVSDGFFKTSSVGAIAVSTSRPNTIYAGMGECCPRGDLSHGDGVYKSADGGKSWIHVGLEATRHIARIRIHPQNSQLVYVAALGHIFAANKERGIYRSQNGGRTWEQVLYKGENAGAIDLVMDPEDPQILYAALWETRRYPWGYVSGGKGSAIYRSKDGGNSWTNISKNPGFPEGIYGRIGRTISAGRPERIYAIVEAKKNGLFRSEDGGNTWKRISSNPQNHQRPWYYHHIKADPQNADTLYVMNVGFWKSSDGGKTCKRISTPHGDNHDLWIDPRDPLRLIEGNDGGATVSFDGGKTWSSIYNQPTAQFYHVTCDQQFPYRVYGAQQDNSTISVPSRSSRGAITRDEWYSVGGCECGYIAVRPDNANIVYAGCYGGHLTRYNHANKLIQDISVWPDNPMGWGARDLTYRFQWTFPIILSPHNPDILFAAANRLFRSSNEGKSWQVISPDLTRNDKSKMESSGGPLSKDNTSVEYYGTIFTFAESPMQKGLFWAGSDDGLIHISRDGGKKWQNVTPKNFPEWALISIIEPSHFDPATAFVAATRYKHDDFRPFLLKTNDYGQTWQKITRGIPHDDFTRVIREDLTHKGILYAGTESGVYFSLNSGSSWQSMQLNLPVTPIHDLMIHQNDLVAATHGRSFWILDDLGKLYQLNANKLLPDIFLFQPAQTVRFRGRYRSKVTNAGQTLPVGIIIDFYLKKMPEKALTLTVHNQKGEVVKTFSSKPKGKGQKLIKVKQGLNQVVWDFRLPGVRRVKGAVFWAGSDVIPIAPPGKYQVRLSLAQTSIEREISVIKDPRYGVSAEDYQKQFELLVNIRDKVSEVHDVVNEIRHIRRQVEDFIQKVSGKSYKNKVREAAKILKDKLFAVEDALIQHRAKARQDLLNYPIRLNNKLTALAGTVQRAEGAPTQQAFALFMELAEKVDIQLQAFKEIVETDVTGFNRLIFDLKVPAIILKQQDKK